ncbi:hypothetical protein D3C86_1086110 [compost metagenome]
MSDSPLQFGCRNRCIRDIISAHIRLSIRSCPCNHSGCRNLRLLPENSFDFPQFHAVSANFDLIIFAAEEHDGAVFAPFGQIPRPVHARSWHKRIGCELFPRQLLPIQVTPRHTRPGNA